MGVDAGDYDGDGWMDLVVTNFAHDSNTLYRNLGNGALRRHDARRRAWPRPTFERMGWGTAFFDADLDGRLDLFFANGHIYPQVDEFPALKETFRQESQLFLGDGRAFRDVSDTAGGGLQVQKSSRGLAVGDLDDDGDLDLVLGAMDDVPTCCRTASAPAATGSASDCRRRGPTPSPSAPGSPSRRRDAGRCGRSTPGGATSRRATFAHISAWAPTRGP